MMQFTGERFVPQLKGEIKYEHLHRYALCLKFAKEKTILDIASGEGYGSFILSKEAKKVTGVDIDQESIRHAQEKYHDIKNLSFLLGDCTAIPLPNNSVDVVTSFETIEHHDKHEEMILEIKRVLKENGQLIISSPNKLVYSDEPNYSNPYHVKELYYEEFLSLLSRHFRNIELYGQRLASASFVSPLRNNSPSNNYTAYTGEPDNLEEKTCSLLSPVYFLAICSDEQFSEHSIESIYIDATDDLFKLLQDDRRRAQIQLAKYELELQNVQSHSELIHHELAKIQSELEQSQSQLQQTQSELEQSQSQLQQTQSELEQSQSQLQQTQSELEQSQSQLQQTQSELEQSQSQLQQTQSELEQSQSQLQQTQSELEQSQSQLQQTQSELEQSQSQLQQTQSELEQSQSQLQQTQSELEQSQRECYQQLDKNLRQLHLAQNGWERSLEIIKAMESSKFWKIRQAWFKIKTVLGLKNI